MNDADTVPEPEGRPLDGLRVVVTRPPGQAGSFARRLRRLGADPVLCPTIRIEPPEDPAPLRRAAERMEEYRWLVFTSVNGVERLAETLERMGRAPGSHRAVRVAAIGPSTAERVGERLGLRPEVVPEEFRAEALARAIRRHAAAPGEGPPPWPGEEALEAGGGELEGARVLLPRAAEARAVLPERLEAAGAVVEEVAAYRAVPPAEDDVQPARRGLEAGEVDWLTFTASSTVRHFASAVGTEVGRARVAVIGPITADTAREVGLPVHAVADEYTVPGLCRALVGAAGGGGGIEAA